MELVSINIGQPRLATFNGVTVKTGIFKRPIAGRVAVRKTNVEGDGQADLSVHGGIDKAVYGYPREHYDFWKDVLGVERDFEFGQFGENLTVARMLETEVCIGDVFRVGTVMLQVSQPRTPCLKLGIRMRWPTFPKLFMASRRTGFYFRVLQEGALAAGDIIESVEQDPAGITVEEMFCLYHQPQDRRASAERALNCAALADDWQREFRKRLVQSKEQG